MHAAYIGMHDLVEGFIGNVLRWTEIGIESSVAHQSVDRAEGFLALGNQVLQLLLVVNVASHCDGLPTQPVYLAGHLVTGVLIATGYDDLRSLFCHARGDGFTNPLGGSGNEGNIVFQTE